MRSGKGTILAYHGAAVRHRYGLQKAVDYLWNSTKIRIPAMPSSILSASEVFQSDQVEV
jgi:hypothetical protein